MAASVHAHWPDAQNLSSNNSSHETVKKSPKLWFRYLQYKRQLSNPLWELELYARQVQQQQQITYINLHWKCCTKKHGTDAALLKIKVQHGECTIKKIKVQPGKCTAENSTYKHKKTMAAELWHIFKCKIPVLIVHCDTLRIRSWELLYIVSEYKQFFSLRS